MATPPVEEEGDFYTVIEVLCVKSLCVFCSSSEGASPAYAEAARRLGVEIARRGLLLGIV